MRRLSRIFSFALPVIAAAPGCGDFDESATPDAEDTGFDTGATHPVSDPDATRAKTTASISNLFHLPYGSGVAITATTYSGHYNAWDFVVGAGTVVVAMADGRVDQVGSGCSAWTGRASDSECNGGYGNYVRIDDDADGYYHLVAHLDRQFVVAGQWVRQGQALGTVGTSGRSNGVPHIHAQVMNSADTISYNPIFYYYNLATGARDSTRLSHGTSYTSYNSGVFEDTRDANGGTAVVGTSSPKIATMPDANGFSKSYVGGSLGDTTIYYEALGFDAARGYNNTNQTWLLQGAMRSWYYSCGGPAYCWLGYPTGARVASGSGWRQTFRCGYLTESASGSVSATSYTCG